MWTGSGLHNHDLTVQGAVSSLYGARSYQSFVRPPVTVSMRSYEIRNYQSSNWEGMQLDLLEAIR